MNIILIRQQERLKKIDEIEASIKNSKDPDIKKLIMMCCAEWGMSERSVKEYIKIAQWEVKNEN